jgi:hypothetical protein
MDQDSLQFLNSQIMKFRQFLGIKILGPYHLLKIWSVRIEN